MKNKLEYTGFRMPPLITGTLIKRYKRFLADVELENGKKVTVHCPNSGSMKGCAFPGSKVWLSKSDNPKRKYKYTWELIKVPGTLIGINTLVPNKLVKQSIENGLIKELREFTKVKAEIKTSKHTRLDLLLENEHREKCYVEIKNCTLVEEGTAMFPDAVTTRGQKHLDELCDLVSRGHRGIIFYLIQRMDAKIFKPAEMIDKTYAEKLRKSKEKGVQIITRDTTITSQEIRIRNAVPVQLF
ncbi:MAG: DNA/RNA nuclease SfsA [Desulfobacteraceae bacterium]|nr:DNA/RNA nuclease SfsA [Desulfobacteraceae bacterium]